MSRRPPIRKSDIENAAATLLAHGLRPKAIDFLPSGGIRFHFDDPTVPATDELDKELAELEARHGEG